MSRSLLLLETSGGTRTEELAAAPIFSRPTSPLRSRIAYAAAHVIPKPWAENVPGAPAEIDWDSTLDFRRHVWSWGLGVADAMDTAQRNMGLDAAATRELISRSASAAREVAASVVAGVNTDHVDDESLSLQQIVDAYVSQLEFTEEAGAGVVLMASRHLARTATSPADYERVYGEVLSRATTPVILHWLGTAFDPQLAGYFGADQGAATDTLVRIIEDNADHVSGVKMSLLDADAEIAVRARLPKTAAMYTGDDFNYVGLIDPDDGREVGSRDLDTRGLTAAASAGRVAPERSEDAYRDHAPNDAYSNALLGAFAAIAPNASAAIQALDRDDHAEYRRILGPTEALSRQIFAAPTFYYKTGVAFLSWLNGHQQSFTMVGGLHSARSLPHLSEIVRLANASGALERPELAAARWHGMLAQNGIA